MLLPQKNSAELAKLFAQMLEEENYIEPETPEEFAYYLEINKISKRSMDDLQAWAFYYAVKRDSERAIDYFKRSFYFEDPEFCSNYLYYLILLKKFDACEEALIRAVDKYPVSIASITKLQLFFAILKGDEEGILDAFDNLIKLKNEESDYYRFLKAQYLAFMQNMGFSGEMLQLIGKIYQAICHQYSFITYPKITFEVDEEHGLNAIVFALKSEKDVMLIPELNGELADRLSQLEQLDGKVFTATFDMIRNL